MEQSPPATVLSRLRQVSVREIGPFSVRSWCLLIGIPALLYTFNLGGARALTQHEVYVASPVKHMLHDGGWLLPRVGDQLWLEKPPLTHWLAAASSWIAGDLSEATLRFPSAVAGVGVILLASLLMTKLFGPTIGWLAGAAQATSVYMLAYSRLAESDIELLLTTMAAITVFVHFIQLPDDASPSRKRFWLWSFWILIGLTNLSKGLLFGAVLTSVTCFGWLVVAGDWRKLIRSLSPVGILLAAGIAVAWPIAVVIQAPEALELWKSHLFGRAADGIGYSQPVWYYLKTWPVQLLPWTPFVFFGAGPSLRRAWLERTSPDRFIWWWGCSQLFLLSLSSGKHHHYLIYALPAMSPVIAMGVLRVCQMTHHRNRWTINWGRFVCFGVPSLLAVGVIAAGSSLGDLRPHIFALTAVAAVGCAMSGYFTIRGLPTPAFSSVFAVVIFANLYVQYFVMPWRDPSAADKEFLQAIDRELPADAHLVAVGQQEIARHLFYINRPIDGIWESADISKVLHGDKEFYAITREYGERGLEPYGEITRVKQSSYTRREDSPADRYTLFRVKLTSPQLAGKTQHERR